MATVHTDFGTNGLVREITANTDGSDRTPPCIDTASGRSWQLDHSWASGLKPFAFSRRADGACCGISWGPFFPQTVLWRNYMETCTEFKSKDYNSKCMLLMKLHTWGDLATTQSELLNGLSKATHLRHQRLKIIMLLVEKFGGTKKWCKIEKHLFWPSTWFLWIDGTQLPG